MQIPPSELRAGDPVRIRGQRWRVRDIRDYGSCRLLAVTGIGAANQAAERRFLTPFDRVASLRRSSRSRLVSARVWPRALRALLTAEGPADALRVAARAEIQLLPHQLEPAIALLRGMGTRVLLADEVGLGKTVQAALAIAELRVRGLADRILIATPAGLRDQWRDELSRRFSIEAVVMDARELRRRAALAPLGVNPWTTVEVVVTSTDFVKRPEVLPAALDTHWDIVVVDEAHGAGPPSDRHAAASALCLRTPCVLLLTATPHNGDRQSFEALCGLGAAGDDALLVFRRTRHDVALGVRRRIHRLHVTPGDAERLVHDRLIAFASAVRAERTHDAGALRLGLGVLFKRAFSSPWSLARSVERRLAALTPRPPGTAQPLLPFDVDEEEVNAGDEPPAWTVPALDDPERERRLLEGVAEAARAAAAAESKLAALRRLLRRLLRLGEQAIVFTEYRDTLVHLRRALRLPAAVLHGGMARDERRQALAEFAARRAPVLLATDAAGEGLNLQDTCRVVINLELPWNPNRLEQRAGRVDRIGQKRTVHTVHLIARGTGEAVILDRLRTRIAQARRDIDAADPLDLWSDEHDREVAIELSTRQRTSVDVGPEYARLLTVRQLSEPAEPARSRTWSPAGPIVSLAGRRLRTELRSRVLAIFSSTLEDACGRPIAVRVVPALLDLSPPAARPVSRLRMEALVRLCEDAVATVDREALDTWISRNRAAHRLLWQQHLRREEAIRAACSAAAGEVQLGLFDRRAERAARAAAERRGAWDAASDERIAQIQRNIPPGDASSRVALVLLP